MKKYGELSDTQLRPGDVNNGFESTNIDAPRVNEGIQPGMPFDEMFESV